MEPNLSKLVELFGFEAGTIGGLALGCVALVQLGKRYVAALKDGWVLVALAGATFLLSFLALEAVVGNGGSLMLWLRLSVVTFIAALLEWQLISAVKPSNP